LSQTCDNGATFGNTVSGFIKASKVIITSGQTCNYTDCEFLGSLTINGARAALQNCKVDGNLTINSGTLNLAPLDASNPQNRTQSVRVLGNTNIGNPQQSSPIRFSVGPGAYLNGGLDIQNLSAPGNGNVCGSTVTGGLTVNNNMTTIDIGPGSTAPNCGANTISGGFSCKNNTPAPTGGGNTVSGGTSPQCPH
jgi:hypothetical protein